MHSDSRADEDNEEKEGFYMKDRMSYDYCERDGTESRKTYKHDRNKSMKNAKISTKRTISRKRTMQFWIKQRCF